MSIKGKKLFTRGFTIIEIMVAMTIFVTVVVMCSGAILSIFNANQKSKSLRSVMDNLNLTMESMTRAIRFGTNYHCGSIGDTTTPFDCSVPANSLTVKDVGGVQTTYSLQNGRIVRTVAGTNFFMTSSDANITTLAFRVYGSPAYNSGADLFQPQVIIVVRGTVGSSNKASAQSTFTLETTNSQRVFDFQ